MCSTRAICFSRRRSGRALLMSSAASESPTRSVRSVCSSTRFARTSASFSSTPKFTFGIFYSHFFLILQFYYGNSILILFTLVLIMYACVITYCIVSSNYHHCLVLIKINYEYLNCLLCFPDTCTVLVCMFDVFIQYELYGVLRWEVLEGRTVPRSGSRARPRELLLRIYRRAA